MPKDIPVLFFGESHSLSSHYRIERLPVLLLGENHSQIAHYLIERDTLRHMQGKGFDTLAMEIPHDLEQPLQAYLASSRGEKEGRAFADEWTRRHREAMAQAGGDGKPVEIPVALLKYLWLAEDAHDLGYEVRCIDVSIRDKIPKPEETKFEWSDRRDVFRADRIAAAYKAGHTMIVHTGNNHLTAGSLGYELDQRGVPSEAFALLDQGQAPPAPYPLLTFVAHGAEVEETLQKKKLLETAFQRALPAIPEPQQNTWSRRPDILRQAIESDRHRGI